MRPDITCVQIAACKGCRDARVAGGGLTVQAAVAARRGELWGGTMVFVRIEVGTASEITRLALVGNCKQLGNWDLAASLALTYDGGSTAGSMWWTPPLFLFCVCLP